MQGSSDSPSLPTVLKRNDFTGCGKTHVGGRRREFQLPHKPRRINSGFSRGRAFPPNFIRTQALFGSVFSPRGMAFKPSFRNDVPQRKPVIPPPAEQAPHRPQSKHLQQPINRAQLSLFEFQGMALGAFMPYPKQMGNPARPGLCRKIHTDRSSRATSASR